MSRIKLIHHVNVPISDRERTRDWYEKVLGGNMIELVYHPLGLEDADGHKLEVLHHPRGVRWTLRPGLAESAEPRR